MFNLFIFFIIIFFIIFIIIKKEENKTLKPKNNNNQNKNSNNLYAPNLIRRKELESLLDSNFNNEDKKYIFDLFENKCYKCNNKNNLEIDHHVPLTLGYSLKYEKKYNAVLLCKNCNRKKANILPQDFYSEKELKKLEEKYQISSHLNIDFSKINKINKILTSEKIKILRKAIEQKRKVSFVYYKISFENLFQDRLVIIADPIEIYENIEFNLYSKKKIYILKAMEKNSDIFEEFKINYIFDLIIK